MMCKRDSKITSFVWTPKAHSENRYWLTRLRTCLTRDARMTKIQQVLEQSLSVACKHVMTDDAIKSYDINSFTLSSCHWKRTRKACNDQMVYACLTGDAHVTIFQYKGYWRSWIEVERYLLWPTVAARVILIPWVKVKVIRLRKDYIDL